MRLGQFSKALLGMFIMLSGSTILVMCSPAIFSARMIVVPSGMTRTLSYSGSTGLPAIRTSQSGFSKSRVELYHATLFA